MSIQGGMLKSLVLVLLAFIVSTMVMIYAAAQWSAHYGKVAVTGRDELGLFPVLVVLPGEQGRPDRAEIVFGDHLPQYLRNIPSYSFLVPSGEVEELNRQVARQEQLASDGRSGPGRFEVELLPGGKQLVKVVATWGGGIPHVETGWCVADSNGFTPKYYHSYFAPGAIISWSLFLLPLNGIIWTIGGFVYHHRKRRLSSQSPGAKE